MIGETTLHHTLGVVGDMRINFIAYFFNRFRQMCQTKGDDFVVALVFSPETSQTCQNKRNPSDKGDNDTDDARIHKLCDRLCCLGKCLTHSIRIVSHNGRDFHMKPIAHRGACNRFLGVNRPRTAVTTPTSAVWHRKVI